VNVGQTVVAGLNAPSLFLLARDLNRMQVWAAVNEADISEIHEGQKVMFKVDAYRDRTFSGVVSQIRLNAGMSNSVVTYGVVVDIDNSDGKLLPYMTANLQFEVARRDHTLLVPNQALRWRPTLKQITPGERAKFQAPAPGEKGQEEPVEVATPIVWLQSPDGLVHGKPVTAGLSDGMSTEIKSDDLPEGSLLVVGTMRRAKRDFVSSFVSRVTKTGTGE
jgi:HlyD family secretion protein